jgi:hypothetical protein
MGEKYLLTVDPIQTQMNGQYESIGQYDYVYAFRNNWSLPFGLFLTSYMPESAFGGLSTPAKENTLRYAVILPDADLSGAAGLSSRTNDEAEAEAKSMNTFAPPPASDHVEGFAMSSFSQNRIVGSIRCGQAGILVFQTAFDAGWRILVDGLAVKPFRVDGGLLGIRLVNGEHHMEISYFPPLLPIGIVVTTTSLVILIVMLRRWPRFPIFASTRADS